MKRAMAVVLVLAGLVASASCGSSPTAPTAVVRPNGPNYEGGGYMGSGD